MKKIFESKEILPYIENCKYKNVLKDISSKIFLAQYQSGEFLTAPFQKENLFQIIVQGKVNIYFVRNDGTKYSLSSTEPEYILGETEIFKGKNESIYAEAMQDVVCLSLSIENNRKELFNNNHFLRLLAESLAEKMQLLTMLDVAPVSLDERVISYMKYKCPSGILKGMEQAGFYLHCSTRQLQRIMNRYEENGIVTKIGKGTYQFNQNHQL